MRMRRRSACAGPLVQHEGDLHDHPELGHLVVLHHGLELLGPDGLDVADRAGRALDRLADRLLIALRGLAGQFDELPNRHECLPRSLGRLWSNQTRSKATRLPSRRTLWISLTSRHSRKG